MKPQTFQAKQSKLIMMCCYADTMTTQPEILMRVVRETVKPENVSQEKYLYLDSTSAQ